MSVVASILLMITVIYALVWFVYLCTASPGALIAAYAVGVAITIAGVKDSLSGDVLLLGVGTLLLTTITMLVRRPRADIWE